MHGPCIFTRSLIIDVSVLQHVAMRMPLAELVDDARTSEEGS